MKQLKGEATWLVTEPACVQVHPVVSRLCAPIEGTDAARLADCLGLDTARYAQAAAAANANAVEEALLGGAALDDEERYKVRGRLRGGGGAGVRKNGCIVWERVADKEPNTVRGKRKER